MSVLESNTLVLEQLRTQMSLLKGHFIVGRSGRTASDIKRDVLIPLYKFSMPNFEEARRALEADPGACDGISLQMVRKFHSAVLSARMAFLPWQHLTADEIVVTPKLKELLALHVPAVIHSMD